MNYEKERKAIIERQDAELAAFDGNYYKAKQATGHTPGPWNTGGLMTRVEFCPKGWNAPLCIADCGTKSAPGSKYEQVANARLIATAPEMLGALNLGREALGNWVEIAEDEDKRASDYTALTNMDAAIAKATEGNS